MTKNRVGFLARSITDSDIEDYDGKQQKLIHKQKSRSVKCTTRFPSTPIYRPDCFLQPTKTLFIAGTYYLLENLG
jgi:hypothetical protein